MGLEPHMVVMAVRAFDLNRHVQQVGIKAPAGDKNSSKLGDQKDVQGKTKKHKRPPNNQITDSPNKGKGGKSTKQ